VSAKIGAHCFNPNQMVKVAYPVSNDRDQLSSSLLALKIARHSPCTLCSCTGLHPSPGITVVSDDTDVYDEADDDDDDSSPQSYLESCECGHDVRAHNANEKQLDRGEWIRRSNVGIRIDEILQVLCFILFHAPLQPCSRTLVAFSTSATSTGMSNLCGNSCFP
jgi:hypothetical protein